MATLIVTRNQMKDQVREMQRQVKISNDQNEAFLRVAKEQSRPILWAYTSPPVDSTWNKPTKILSDSSGTPTLYLDSIIFKITNLGHTPLYLQFRGTVVIGEDVWNKFPAGASKELISAFDPNPLTIHSPVDVYVLPDSTLEFPPVFVKIPIDETIRNRSLKTGNLIVYLCQYIRYSDARGTTYDFLTVLGFSWAASKPAGPTNSVDEIVINTNTRHWIQMNRGDLIVTSSSANDTI